MKNKTKRRRKTVGQIPRDERQAAAPSSKKRNSKSPSRGRRSKSASQAARAAGLSTINRVRKGKSKSLSAAARAEGTTVRTIQRLLPAALIQDHPGGRIRVKAGDPYSQLVEIVTEVGAVLVKARGSHQRDLAGRHRSVYIRVLRKKLPSSALEEFRGLKVGGRELLSDPDRLFILANAGDLDQLDALYVSPEAGG